MMPLSPLRFLRRQTRRQGILITNLQLTEGTGTEQVVRDLAVHLGRRGYTVAAYSPRLGAFAARMRDEGIRVVSRLQRLGWRPDLIHGHHHLETMQAIREFPEARALFVCHDGRLWADHPPTHPRLVRYVVVDNNCRERIAQFVPPERLRMIGNWFDADRFQPRAALPPRPGRALFFSNYAGLDPALLGVLRKACLAEGITLDLLGEANGNRRADPEKILGGYDLVFAKGKCAIEALATGCAVIVCHERPGPLVTTLNMEVCRQWNFGLRLATAPIDTASVRREIRAYDAEDAAKVSCFVRDRCHCATALSAYELLYDEICSEPMPAGHDDDSTNLEALLRSLASLAERCRDHGAAPACGPLRPDQMRLLRLAAIDRPASLQAGAEHEIRVQLHNGSDASVSTSAPSPVLMSFQWTREGLGIDHDWESRRTPLHVVVTPGSSVQCAVHVLAPREPGRYLLRIMLVQEGVAWFDQVAPETACSFPVQVEA